MKKILILFLLGHSLSALANTDKYIGAGCQVEVEQRGFGQIFYVTKNSQTEVLGLTNDLAKGTFAYCDDSVLQIHSFTGSKGTGVMMSCSEHLNGNVKTRGRVDLEFFDKKLNKIAINGQVKKWYGWKKETQIVCDKLIKQ